MATARRLIPNQHQAGYHPPSSPAQRAHKPAVAFCILSCSCFRSLNTGTCKTLKGSTSLHFFVLGASPASQVPALLSRLLAIASLIHSTGRKVFAGFSSLPCLHTSLLPLVPDKVHVPSLSIWAQRRAPGGDGRSLLLWPIFTPCRSRDTPGSQEARSQLIPHSLFLSLLWTSLDGLSFWHAWQNLAASLLPQVSIFFWVSGRWDSLKEQ